MQTSLSHRRYVLLFELSKIRLSFLNLHFQKRITNKQTKIKNGFFNNISKVELIKNHFSYLQEEGLSSEMTYILSSTILLIFYRPWTFLSAKAFQRYIFRAYYTPKMKVRYTIQPLHENKFVRLNEAPKYYF